MNACCGLQPKSHVGASLLFARALRAQREAVWAVALYAQRAQALALCAQNRGVQALALHAYTISYNDGMSERWGNPAPQMRHVIAEATTCLKVS